MLVTFILGIAAGWLSPKAEDRIRQTLNDALPEGVTVSPDDMPRLSLALCLLVASVLAIVLGTTHAIPLTLGVVVGVAGPRVVETWRVARSPDYDS